MTPVQRRLLVWAVLVAGTGMLSLYAAGAVAVLGISLELAVAKWTQPDALGWMAIPVGVAVVLLLLQLDAHAFRFLGVWGSDIAENVSRVLAFIVSLMCIVGFVTLDQRLHERRAEERRKGLRPYPKQTRSGRVFSSLAERTSNFLTARMDAAERFDKRPIGRVVSIIGAVLIFGVLVALYLRR